jgi:hypothetical protein
MPQARLPKGAAPIKSPADIPHLERGDEVYFQHSSGPKCGKVLAYGAHGCTVDVAGAHHKVTYDRLLGHKVRVTQNLKLVDEGEDGFVAEGADGRRRYFHDPLTEEGAEPTMAKSLQPRILLFFEHGENFAKAIANRPGLQLQNVTDKAGHQTKRWKKTMIALPKTRARGQREESAGGNKPAPGDSVGFKAGDFEGKGEVVGKPGKDGSHVKDSSGRLHGVSWDEMQAGESGAGGKGAPKDGDGKRVVSGEEKPKTGGNSLNDRPPFPKAEVDALPDKVGQPYDNWEKLKTEGEKGLEEFTDILGGVAKELNLRTDKGPGDLEDKDFDSADGFLFIGKLKGEDRAQQKVKSDYHGDWTQLRDVVRGTISVANMDELRHAVRAVEAKGLKLAQKPKDRFSKPTREGYRDLLTIVKLPNGMLAELQYHVKSMTKAKDEGHHLYKEQRDLVQETKEHPDYRRDQEDEDGPQPYWTPDQHKKFHHLVNQQKKIYDPAWERASKTRQSG